MKTLCRFFTTVFLLQFTSISFASGSANKIIPFPDDQLFVGRGSSLEFSFAEAEENATNDAKETCRPYLAIRVSEFTDFRMPGGLAGVGAFATFYCITYK